MTQRIFPKKSGKACRESEFMQAGDYWIIGDFGLAN